MSVALLNPDLMMLEVLGESEEEVLSFMANTLLSKGYVKETYPNAILKREKEFSTGLPGNGYGVAIPHTDPEHVNQSIMAVGLLKKPVKFKMMGNHDEQIDVELCFMLALKESHSHIQILQRLMNVIQDEKIMKKIKNVASQSELYELLSANIE